METAIWSISLDDIEFRYHYPAYRETTWSITFGFDGEYLIVGRYDPICFFEIRDTNDVIIAGPDTLSGYITKYNYPVVFNKFDSCYYAVMEEHPRDRDSRDILVKYNGVEFEIINIDTSEIKSIGPINFDNYGNLIYTSCFGVHARNCRSSEIWIIYDDSVFVIDDTTLHSIAEIVVDPYTNNIWFCYYGGFLLYNKDSIWFDIREYEYIPDDAIKESPKTAIAHHNLNVYPNPAKGKVHIESLAREKLYIYDIKGKLIDILPPGVDVWQPENIPIGTYIFETTRTKDNTKLTSKVLLID